MATSYYDCGVNERKVFTHLKKKMFDHNKYNVQSYTTDPSGNDTYDAAVIIFRKPTDDDRSAGVIKSFIIEVKVRSNHYPDLMLEQTKYSAMVKAAKYMTNYSLIYMCTTPMGTYCFDLTSPDIDMKWIKEEHNKSTVFKSEGGKIKRVYYLPIDKAYKVYPLTTNDIAKLDTDNVVLDKEVVKSKQLKTLTELLFGVTSI